MKKDVLTLTIKVNDAEAIERLMKALTAALTPEELEEFKKKMAEEIKRVEAKVKKRRTKSPEAK